ncbi:MAG: molybdopterin-dependent oxidoreductase [Gordonibacter pamelaeae]
MNTTLEWAKNLDFIVSIDPYFTEGAKWADIVLPACHALRERGGGGQPEGGLQPAGAAEQGHRAAVRGRTDFRIQRELAERLGVADALPKTSRAWVDAMLGNSRTPTPARSPSRQINENHGAYPLEGIEKPRQEFPDLVFGTTSGRMDVYYDNLVDFGQALPAYEDPSEAYDGNPARETSRCSWRTCARASASTTSSPTRRGSSSTTSPTWS